MDTALPLRIDNLFSNIKHYPLTVAKDFAILAAASAGMNLVTEMVDTNTIRKWIPASWSSWAENIVGGIRDGAQLMLVQY